MPRYKYSNLFPRIHPLKKSTDVDVAIVRFNLPQKLKQPLKNVYGYVLDKNYLTTEKIEKSLAFLERAYSGDSLLEQVRKFTTEHCLNGCFKNTPELNFEDIYFFWVFIVSAFLYLNEYIKTEDKNYLTCAKNCFYDSTLYKNKYHNIQPRQRGGKDNILTQFAQMASDAIN